MEDVRTTRCRALDIACADKIALEELDAVTLQIPSPGRFTYERPDRVAPPNELAGKMATGEARSARDEGEPRRSGHRSAVGQSPHPGELRKHEIDPGPPVDTNVWKLSEDERRQYQMDSLPANLKEAVEALQRDEVLTSALGEHILFHFVEAKKKEWTDYIAQVSQWELDTYLATY